MKPENLKEFLKQEAFSIAENDNDILSLNIVGSFADKNDLSGISDIDTVVIVDHLTQWVFESIVQKFHDIGPKLKEGFGYNLKINTTFGPLKFNEDNLVVYHLMIYDRAAHVDHCRKSPFTCYNWQATKLFCKQHISEFYKVRTLMPHYFFNARRGINDYLKDYNSGVISYRSYVFEDGKAFEEKHKKNMNTKDRYEFVFHIMRFIMHNFLKMIFQENIDYNKKSIINNFLNYFPKLNQTIRVDFLELEKIKASNNFSNMAIDLDQLDKILKNFLNEFEIGFKKYFASTDTKISFVRHGKTDLNKENIFLGQKLDPSIISFDNSERINQDLVYSSPMKRCLETVKTLTNNKKILISELLKEIDYGLAEGLNYKDFSNKYHDIIKEWSLGKDPKFPEGENTRDVYNRVKNFIRKILAESSDGDSLLVVSHNVWLRCLIGSFLSIPQKDWYLIDVPHVKEIRFLKNPKGGILPDFTIEDQVKFLKNIEKKELLLSFKAHSIETREKSWREIYSYKQNNRKRKFLEGTCLIPMAGEGKRFSDYGFQKRKPLIHVEREQMIDRVLDCLPDMEKYVFLVREENLPLSIKKHSAKSEFIPIKNLTQGQASTCKIGIDQIALDKPLLVAACDNGMLWNYEKFNELRKTGADFICWTFSKNLVISDSPQSWGYVAIDEKNNIKNVSVKKPLTSNPFYEQCIIGTFWFKNAKIFNELYEGLIKKDLRVNGEFYVDSMVSLAIENGLIVKNFEVDHYISWGKPEDLFEYRKWNDLQSLYA